MLSTPSLSFFPKMPFLALMIFASNGYALQFSNASPIIAPEQNSAAVKVLNDTSKGSFVTIDIEQLSLPTAQGESISHGADIVASQKRFILSSKEQKPIILRYQGPQDDKERYYRVTWKQQFVQLANVAVDSRVLPMTVDTLLVVNPRKDNFHYLYNKGVLLNDGNSSFRISAYGKCAGNTSKNCHQDAYLLPGASSHFMMLDRRTPPSYITVNYNNHYYSVH